jgi:spore maturation protein CgeB
VRIGFYGSSLLSAYWNGAATYYRGVIRALAERGHRVTFFEPRAFGRQERADIEPPEWCEVVVYEPDQAGLAEVLAGAADFDAVVKASGVGVLDRELAEAIATLPESGPLRIYWDVDAAATQAELTADPHHYLTPLLPRFDMVLTYGGGPVVLQRYEQLGARQAHAIYNALDPATHHPAPRDPRFAGDLAFLGNRLPDREGRVEQFFIAAAEAWPEGRFLIGGAGWDDKRMPPNVVKLGHVSTADHNALNCTPRAVLNIARDSMADVGFSPATRVFEAAGAGACLITDAWKGLETFLIPGEEVLVAHDGAAVVRHLRSLTAERAAAIGAAARRRVLAEHTYDRRAAEVEAIFTSALDASREAA